eukprot:6200251-Pleurochrysis_carterae.AAC.1
MARARACSFAFAHALIAAEREIALTLTFAADDMARSRESAVCTHMGEKERASKEHGRTHEVAPARNACAEIAACGEGTEGLVVGRRGKVADWGSLVCSVRRRRQGWQGVEGGGGGGREGRGGGQTVVDDVWEGFGT